MKVGEAAYRMVSGGRSLRTERAASVQGRMSELERAAGSKTAAARDAGVTLRTWQRWRAGTQKPRPATLDRLRAAQRRARLPASRERKLRRGTGTLYVDGAMAISSDVRTRGVSIPGGDLSERTRDDLVDAFLRGSEEELAAALQEAMSAYVPGLTIEDVDHIAYS